MESTSAPVLEASLLKGPFEKLKRCAKDRKAAMEEVNSVLNSLAKYSQPGAVPPDDALASLDQMISNLTTLKRKLDDTNDKETVQLQRCRARIQHLQLLSESTPNLHSGPWVGSNLDRILVDHMLRSGYFESAEKLANDSNITDLVDFEVFREAREVVNALRRRDCSLALQWCDDNSTQLKKLKSKLIFKLRRGEFLELVRKNDEHVDAIAYARRHLSTHANAHMQELQQAMATLVFKDSLETSPYKYLFEEQHWEDLIETFQNEIHRVNHLTPESLLTVYMQAGLSALKTPASLQPDCNIQDPLHLESFRKMAEGLPFAKHLQSKLVCRITHEIMDEHNPPMVLPNGYVYSLKAMEEMSQKNNGKIICPRSGLECEFKDLVKAFIS